MRLQLSTTKHLPTQSTRQKEARYQLPQPPPPSSSNPSPTSAASSHPPLHQHRETAQTRIPSPVPRPRASRRAKTSPRCPHRRVDPTSSGRPACTRPGPAGHSLSGGSFLSLAHNRLHSQRQVFFASDLGHLAASTHSNHLSTDTTKTKPQQNARDGEKDELILSIGALDYNYPPSCIHVI